jgi:ATP-dependent RNA helicase DeaD
VGQSATGSGKTAAFAIPAIELAKAAVHKVQCLILCPTSELAVQVAEETGKLLLFKRGLHVVPIYGGQSYDRQFRALAAGVQIVIGTPGRVMDHMERGTLKLDGLKLVVLDEADRMLDMGFRDDIEKILSAVPAERQLLFFSATMPRVIQDLIGRYSRDPAWIRIESHAQNAPQVDQVYYEVDRRSKLEVLTRLIDLNDFRYGLIFCSTKVMVDELDEQLHARGYATDRLHGDLSQMQRNRVMEKFRKRSFEFLVATDVAARGLDVDDLEVVFNFDLPNDAEDYTHRIGRTARAGKSGRAITFVSGREIYKLQSMVRFANLRIRREGVPSLDQVDEAGRACSSRSCAATLDAGVREARPHDRPPARPGLREHGHLLGADPAAEGRPRPGPQVRLGRAAPAAGQARGEAGGPDGTRGRPGGTGARAPDRQEPGMTTLFVNAGRKHLVTTAEIVGKITGVTRLPATAIGAIDIHQRHALVDVAGDQADLVIKKMNGIRVRGHALKVSLATTEEKSRE